MRIAIIGLGNVGSTLAGLWTAGGHQISAARRKGRPETDHPGITFGDTADICAASEVIALCTSWQAAEDALKPGGDLSGKIVIDCTNPLTPSLDGLVLGANTSAAESIQGWYPRASVVKAFNTIGAALLGKTGFNGRKATGFLCGDSADAKRIVTPLVSQAGLEPADVGPLRNARYLEAMAMLWIDLAVNQKRGPSFAFTLTSKDAAV